jgi:hypothetical protein
MDIRNDTRLITRFNKHVDTSGSCHVWTGCINRGGYGVVNVEKRAVQAHRVAYEIANGPFDKAMHVDHICHNRACVSPSHLRLVTRKQNAENREGATCRSKSGVRGVSWQAQQKKWLASAGQGGRKYYGGTFNTIEEAAVAARELRNRLFTHNTIDRLAS